MKERPILFNVPMVRAIMNGTKTQTRRVVKYQAPDLVDDDGWPLVDRSIDGIGEVRAACPYGQPGDRLWLQETWMPDAPRDGTWEDVAFFGCKGSPLSMIPAQYRTPEHVIHRASWDGHDMVGWKPSIHMPRWASRITLEVTGVRVERLQDISEADALSEGIARHADGNGFHTEDGWHYSADPRESFASLWEYINGHDSWDANPWVWAVEFRRIKP